MAAVVLIVIALLCWGVSFLLPKKAASNYDPSPRLVGRIGVSVISVIAAIVLVISCINTVGPKDIGVVTVYGSTEGDVGPGLHFLWPWDSVNIMDGAIQTETFNGDNGIPVRLAYQQTATANITIRWRIERKDADALYKNYRAFSNIEDSLVNRELQSATNNQLSNYNPLNAVDNSGSAPSMQTFARMISSQMRSEIGGEGIDVLSVIMYPLTFAPSTQEKLNQLQTQVADTRVAEQTIQTNKAQATANAELTKDTSSQSLQQQCLNIMSDMVKNNMTPPIGMSCGLGSATTGGLIVDGTTHNSPTRGK